jgi:hypothetical protein
LAVAGDQLQERGLELFFAAEEDVFFLKVG